jgi:S-adenosylmethionine:tRNA ribosyltransferase-isomerase
MPFSPNFLGLNAPESLIAREPLAIRDHSKFFVTQKGIHDKFYHLHHYVNPGDLLILNNTKVEPCRVYAKKETGGKVELLFIEQKNIYEGWAIYQSSQKLKKNTILICQSVTLMILEVYHGKVLLKSTLPLSRLFDSKGHVPLPPYMQRESYYKDKMAYQSLWAKHIGSCAAPTASLHFTQRVLLNLKNKGVLIDYCTLHVGLGTFLPIKKSINEHVMHEESYYVPKNLIEKIKSIKNNGGKIIAVGTSVMRALESSVNYSYSQSSKTSLFIKPGYQFNIVDRLITNFHQTDSTLMLLVQAFAGKENITKYYREAFLKRYRLYSYGDAMILDKKL